MNIIIAGDGEVGFHLAKSLSFDKHNITVIDANQELLKMIESHTDLMTIKGDSTSIAVLENANIGNADLLISVVHHEHINLMTCILGKKLGAKKTIARINNVEYLTAENRELFQYLGIDSLVCPERIAAKEIINLLNQTVATEVFDFSEGKLMLFLIRLDENALVLDKTLNQIAKEHSNLDFRAVAIHRNSKTIIPRGTDTFQKNDLIYVITKPSGMNELFKLGGKVKIDIKNIMIVGGGRIARKAAISLQDKFNIKLFEINKERCFMLTEDLDKTLIINGDATDIQLLEEEGIHKMDAFIALTDHTETNILTCLHARKFGVKRTIALVENIDYIDISQNIGIDTIINKKLITASYIARFTIDALVTSIKCLSGIDAEVLEFLVKPGSLITKKPIQKLDFPEGAIIGGITRGDNSYIAIGGFQILENDKVVVFALPEAIHKISKLFH
jgi:trk system potassium uptake protein TrkA